MTATAVITELRHRGVELEVKDNALHFRGPTGAVSPALRSDLVAHKGEILEILAMEAVVNYRRLRDLVAALGDEADAAEAAGDLARAGELEAEAIALMNGEAGEALMKMLAFPDELILRVEATLDRVHEEEAPAESDQPWRCRTCGGTVYWERKDGVLMCAVCRPSPEMCAQLPAGIPADGTGRLRIKVLEEVEMSDG